jgi:hypothetical protein
MKNIAMTEVPFMALNIVGDSYPEPDLPAFSVKRPCYLVDTVELPGKELVSTPKAGLRSSKKGSGGKGQDGSVDASFPTFFYADPNDVVFFNGQRFKGHEFFLNKDNDGSTSLDPLYVAPVPADNVATGGEGPPPFDYPSEDVPFTVGSLVELAMSGLEGHMSHMHVNSYQINTYEGGSAQEADQDFTTYFQIGDWHDTLFLGFSQENAPFFASDVRFWVDRYTGKAVMHCHDLEDEDHGMMNGFYLSGQEGTPVDSRTRRIDPTCYSKSKHAGYTMK